MGKSLNLFVLRYIFLYIISDGLALKRIRFYQEFAKKFKNVMRSKNLMNGMEIITLECPS